MIRSISLLAILLALFSSCNTATRTYRSFTHLGGLAYRFSDNNNRILKIEFLTDSTLGVTNRSGLEHNYHLVDFNSQYLYERSEIGTIVILKKIDRDKPLQKSIYRKPYDNRPYTMDSFAYQYIFPDIEGDTLRFSSDFKKLQVSEFCFDKL
ncbi:MAG TPA: hypothetical protein VGD31_02940 [Sphingobacteriaceae bacterium]